MTYEEGQEIEIFYCGYWQHGVIKAVCPMKSRNKKKIPCLFVVGSTEPNHEIHNVREQNLRLPMKYPTRKAVWTIQFRHSPDQPWRIHWASFKRQRIWNHSFNVILHMVKKNYRVFADEQERFQLHNWQTGETIPMAGLCD